MAGLVLSVLLTTQSRAIWLTNLTKILILSPAVGARISKSGIQLSQRAMVQQKEDKATIYLNSKSARVLRMGPGRELYGGLVKTLCNWTANGLKTDPEYRSGI